MKLADRIFRKSRGKKKNQYYVTSSFGWRKDPISNKYKGHNGTDYGTFGEKYPQYALEDGIVESYYKDNYGALCVRVKYPRIGYRLTHAHLDSVKVKTGQKVTKNTILGYTGTTGYSTGIHLHLGVQKIGSSTWLDPEKINYEEKKATSTTNFSFFPKKGYFCFGDTHVNIGKIASFMYKTFPAYTRKEALGNYYGKNIQASVKEFQKRTKLEADGCVGPVTLKKLQQYGFKY